MQVAIYGGDTQFLVTLTWLMFTDGQKIAKRLSSGVDKETNRAKQLLEEYNTISSEIYPLFSPLQLSDILSPDSEMWQKPRSGATSNVPPSLKKDITDAYLMKKRCDEELQLLTTEMHNALDYWRRSAECIKDNIEALRSNSDSDMYSRGLISLLQKRLWVIELTSSKAQVVFSNIISPAESSSPSHYDFHESDFSDSDEHDSDVDFSDIDA